MVGVAQNGGKKKLSKSAYRRQQAKAKRDNPVAPSEIDAVKQASAAKSPSPEPATNLSETDDVEMELDDMLRDQYKEVFSKFIQPPEEEEEKEKDDKPEVYYDDDQNIQDEDEEAETNKRISKRKMKLQSRISLPVLKQILPSHVRELVTETDTNSTDPVLLGLLKATKNVIPVPEHWHLKREYLSSKRGIEKPPFALPKFIADTGISEMRDAVLQKEEQMSLKQKQRERVQGKTKKLDVDYDKWYSAFFRQQTKPEMTKYGEVYYEGKELETDLRFLKPGELSDELKDALGMAPGHPPPWLISQQRLGPPPGYPNLKVPGVNAPIPPGAAWGYTPGQWGKPPIDDAQRALFGGDPTGATLAAQEHHIIHPGEPIERSRWGALRAEGESESEEEYEDDDEEEEEEEEEEEAAEEQQQQRIPAEEVDMSRTRTSTSMASAMPTEVGGVEDIAGDFTLRKQRRGFEVDESYPPSVRRSAGQVISEVEVEPTGFFGSDRRYNLDAARADALGADSRKRKVGDIEASIDFDAVGENGKINKDVLKQHYEAQKKAEQQGQWQSIDQDELSQMIAEESRKRQKREEGRPRGGRR
ncbi:DUF382-domain-containing protein [Polyplosphaeria fusca]|uniref:DUF382-domain-containing protein n=1 Tax=Polyplosphaeria fusca TaxID=682080 RepID=A0A9P4QWM5_9PLEO|nr:DUF382-domain-containing protein [Polyplosphaeria fusca]